MAAKSGSRCPRASSQASINNSAAAEFRSSERMTKNVCGCSTSSIIASPAMSGMTSSMRASFVVAGRGFRVATRTSFSTKDGGSPGHPGTANNLRVPVGRGLSAMDFAVQPVPALGLRAGLGGELATGQGRHGRLLQADGKGPAGHDLQRLRSPREHVHQHAQIDRLARPAGPQHGDHFRLCRLPQGLVGQGHRCAAAAAILGVAGICRLANIARDGQCRPGQFARSHRLQRTAGHTWTSSHSVSSASVWYSADSASAWSSCASVGRVSTRSHVPMAQRKPMLCRRLKGYSPLSNWQVAWFSK